MGENEFQTDEAMVCRELGTGLMDMVAKIKEELYRLMPNVGDKVELPGAYNVKFVHGGWTYEFVGFKHTRNGIAVMGSGGFHKPKTFSTSDRLLMDVLIDYERICSWLESDG